MKNETSQTLTDLQSPLSTMVGKCTEDSTRVKDFISTTESLSLSKPTAG
jgi:hypothetical protein